MRRISRISNNKDDKATQQQLPALARNQSSGSKNQNSNPNQSQNQNTSKVLRYLDDYRSPADAKSLREEGYEIDYDRLVGIGNNSAVFLAHLVNSQPPAVDTNGQRPLYTPGYDMAAKVVAKKWINSRRPSKTRTGNLKLALALGQTKPENNILKVIDVFKTVERIFIFMQYCPYGNVISFIRRNGTVSFRLAQRWSSQMAAALCFLHKFHVAHRNYKLENVLVDENLNAKLTGFGLSKFCIDLQTKQPVLSRTICGSEPYLAPEMLKDSRERFYDPKQSDVWAFGVGLFLCSTRRYPFEAENLRALKADQLAKRYLERDTKKRLRPVVKDILALIFTIEPAQRPTMQDLINQSAWLNQSTVVPATGTPVTPPAGAVQRTGTESKQANQVQAVVAAESSGAAVRRPTADSPTPGSKSPLVRSNSSNASDVSGVTSGISAVNAIQQAGQAVAVKQPKQRHVPARSKPKTSGAPAASQSPRGAGQGALRKRLTNLASATPTSTTEPAAENELSASGRPVNGQQENSRKYTIKTILNPVTPITVAHNQALPRPHDDKLT